MPTESAIRNELEKILRSRLFVSSGHLSRFLRYAVIETLAGNTRDLRESVLGLKIFERGDSFDPRIDPVVRVDAGRLRAKLAMYYQTEGQGDEVVITLPNGGYVPRFSINTAAEARTLEMAPGDDTIVVLPFVSLTEDRNFEYFVDGLTEEVTAALAHVPGLRVVSRSAAFRYRGLAQDVQKIRTDLGVRLVVEGSARKNDGQIRIVAQLIDTVSGFHRWSETWNRAFDDPFGVQITVAEAIANSIRTPASPAPSAANSVIR